MINFIKNIKWKTLGAGVLIGGGLSNEFTIDLLVAVIKLAVS